MDPFALAYNARLQIGRKHAETSKGPLALARWSAGAAVATLALEDIGGRGRPAEGLFASLNQDARDVLECLSRLPVIVPLAVVLVSLYMAWGAFYLAARQVLVGPERAYHVSMQRGALVNTMIRGLGREWMWWHGVGWWAAAIVAGGLTVVVAGALLRGTQTGWLVWALIAVLTWLILKLEALLTSRRYPEPRPSPHEARQRMAQWRAEHPGDTSGMPWIYGYSGLSGKEAGAEFMTLGSSGPVGFTAKLFGLVVIVLWYSALPAPSVESLGDGFIPCTFAEAHAFTGVAEENLGLSMVAALLLFALLPVSVLLSYLRFMVRYRFPPDAIAEVIRREAGFASRSPLYASVGLTVVGFAIALLLWSSAAVANRWDSALLGLAVLVVPSVVVINVVRGRTT